MNQVLLGSEGVECNIDDALVHGKDQQKHNERLEAVLKRLLEAGVTLNLDKCVFSTKPVKFLGHFISWNGIEVDPDKVKAIADLPPPTNVQVVRMFLGMVNQLSKFSDHFANKTKSIRELLLKGSQWARGNAQQKAFKQIKVYLARAPVLVLYDPNKETKIAADAFPYGLGGVDLQLQPDFLETDIFSAEDVDTHRLKICTDRKGSPGAELGQLEIIGMHHWNVNLCGNGPQTFGPTSEHALTGPNPTKNPQIQEEADEIPLQRD